MDRKSIKKLVSEQLAKSADRITDMVIDALIAHLTSGLAPAKKAVLKRQAKPNTRAGVPCISGCGKMSLGPRWRYCCEDHKDAPMKLIKKWQEARKEAQLAKKGTLISTAADVKRFNDKRAKKVKAQMNGQSNGALN